MHLSSLAYFFALVAAKPKLSAHKQITRLHPSMQNLIPGEVFTLRTSAPSSRSVDGNTVGIYGNGTLGIRDPDNLGFRFEAVIFPEYGLMMQPEPCQAVKLNDANQLYVNSSMYNAAPIFSVDTWNLTTADGHVVVCPSWQHSLIYVGTNEEAPCSDAVPVSLGVTPVMKSP